MLDSWVVFRKMNFTDKVGEPNFIATDIFDSTMLKPMADDVILRNFL